MKKVWYVLFVFLFALVFSGCKKKEVLPPPPPKAEYKSTRVTEEKFIQSLGNRQDVKNLKEGDSLIVIIGTKDEVINPSADFLVVNPFKSDYGYYELLRLLKKIPLTVVWEGKDGSHLLIRRRSDLWKGHNSKDKFVVLDPKPAYSVQVGDRTYWVGPSGKFWKTW
jgi:hypothetical protein